MNLRSWDDGLRRTAMHPMRLNAIVYALVLGVVVVAALPAGAELVRSGLIELDTS